MILVRVITVGSGGVQIPELDGVDGFVAVHRPPGEVRQPQHSSDDGDDKQDDGERPVAPAGGLRRHAGIVRRQGIADHVGSIMTGGTGRKVE
ncbi:MAG: hypothetical protein BroJett003_18400 [Planctomycetota bacterium]|nr:MAG: hypothetical protein BroJett003_18400 [Planctomycetota bacterium]